jgi:hypothetical protein
VEIYTHEHLSKDIIFDPKKEIMDGDLVIYPCTVKHGVKSFDMPEYAGAKHLPVWFNRGEWSNGTDLKRGAMLVAWYESNQVHIVRYRKRTITDRIMFRKAQ